MTHYRYNGKLLVIGGHIARSPDCCCEPGDTHETITDPCGFSGYTLTVPNSMIVTVAGVVGNFTYTCVDPDPGPATPGMPVVPPAPGESYEDCPHNGPIPFAGSGLDLCQLLSGSYELFDQPGIAPGVCSWPCFAGILWIACRYGSAGMNATLIQPSAGVFKWQISIFSQSTFFAGLNVRTGTYLTPALPVTGMNINPLGSFTATGSDGTVGFAPCTSFPASVGFDVG